MSRYKGQLTDKRIEREYPYWVDVSIPEGGLDRRLDRMHKCHQTVAFSRGKGSGVPWCALSRISQLEGGIL